MPREIAYLGVKLCRECQTEYEPRKREQMYCSPRCQNDAKARQAREAREIHRETSGSARMKGVSNDTIEKEAPSVLYCPVIYPSLLPYFVADDLYIMTDREYRGLLRSGNLDGLYVEVWRWNSQVSQVFRVCGDVAKMVREVKA